MFFCTSAISANSNPIKSTLSAYTISVGRVFSKSEVGRGKMALTSFRAFSKYMENKTGLTLSPCGDPMLLSNGFSFVAQFILVFMMVSLRRKRIILSFHRYFGIKIKNWNGKVFPLKVEIVCLISPFIGKTLPILI